MYQVPTEDWQPSLLNVPAPFAINAVKSCNLMMSGLNCALNIAKLSVEIHEQRRSRIILNTYSLIPQSTASPQAHSCLTISEIAKRNANKCDGCVCYRPHTHIRPSDEFIYETPERQQALEIVHNDDYDYYDAFLQEAKKKHQLRS